MADQLITGTTLIEDKRSEKGEIWSCSGMEFVTYDMDIDDVRRTVNDNGSISASADGIAFAKCAELPNGATITEAVVFGNAGAAAETWTLKRVAHDQNAVGETIATANIDTIDTSTSNAVVNNDTYHYMFITTTLDTNDIIYGARIKYEF